MRTPETFAVSIFAAACVVLLDGEAAARIQSPEAEACAGKAVDEPCALPSGQAGGCRASKCNELDYSQGTPPRSVEVDCVVCVAGAAATEPPTSDAAPADAGDPPPVTPTPSTSAADAPATEPPRSDAHCAASSASGGLAWLLAPGLIRRRRPRR
jgi:hypothetical protein